MKKLLLLLFLITFCSCGPRRLGCGPRGCDINVEKENYNINPIKNPEARTSGLV
ncbi:hypothetical protein M0M57_04315 [Flavobacterium azooxidireducens]|uniref:Type IV secretion system protein VirB7 n=1 Tax=Flavobacterium azooxidireducens TaxID=1871076 RepID=A0ABY4KGW4_9FLAO|nr:hypothetical protein [Flavobacterium azooxidireducens]UPQ80061.1 hypothetical protein M0M57_04315 [Flavobacterium azooxidireducens]